MPFGAAIGLQARCLPLINRENDSFLKPYNLLKP